jgi:hypothetical protein
LSNLSHQKALGRKYRLIDKKTKIKIAFRMALRDLRKDIYETIIVIPGYLI